MKKIIGKVNSLFLEDLGDFGKKSCTSIQAELDGFEGDRHRSIMRKTWAGDKQREGTIRRNERQWSATSSEEIAEMSEEMKLDQELTGEILGVNICFEGIPNLSRLPKGTIFRFPSGAELMVEEYNPPCGDMSVKISERHTAAGGGALKRTAFSIAGKYKRGLVGVIEVAGQIKAGDEVTVLVYEQPKWLSRL